MIRPYIPVYKRSPNKFERYEERNFDDNHGNGGVVVVAIFKDKNGKLQEMDAQVKWKYRNYKPI